ncbi:YlmC/YmxH family sporulation protein [Risungbinella massiliensis]|uniref:YlmC/YmxH family sporulation protein n=1 Tax=Risungbinella massiliensis TaxID=1329796 RepID=UPI0005CC7CDA|nr:YlmC/YmxH family sporulation protein [Risungbinella massiliensis]
MRWSKFIEKECIDIENGQKLGALHHADLEFDPATGQILSLYIPSENSLFRKKGPEVEVSWRSVRKVGPEMVILDATSKAVR